MMRSMIFAVALAVVFFGGGGLDRTGGPRLYAQAGGVTHVEPYGPDGEWPEVQLGKEGDKHFFQRGPGGYLDPIKIGLLLVAFWIWVKTADWVSQDCQLVGLPYSLWNPIMVFPFFATFFLIALTLPVFIGGYLLLWVSYAVPLGVYLWKRNDRVPPHRRVFTPDHLRHMFAGVINRFGGKMATEKRAAHEKGPEVNLTPMGGDETVNQTNLVEARQTIGFIHAKEILADAMLKRAERLLLEFTADKVAIKYYIDGLWHDLPDRDRESGDLILAVLKKLANLKVDDRRAKQEGKLGVEFKNSKITAALITQGTPTGERATLVLAVKVVKFDTLESLGMRESVAKQVRESTRAEKGLLLVSSLPAGGLTTAATLVNRGLDRFMRDVIVVEDSAARDPEIENIEAILYNGAAGESPAPVLKKALLKQPNVVIVRDFVNGETVQMLLDFIEAESRLVIAGVRAKEALEAVLRVAALKVPLEQLTAPLLGVLNVRLIRKLCTGCKVGYEPTPDLLKKLGISSGRVDVFYREPQPSDYEKPPTEPCQECGGIGYVGRTALFEWLSVDDKLRSALCKSPKLETLRPLARAAGIATLQDEGLVLVAKGVTSLAELQRVLKL